MAKEPISLKVEIPAASIKKITEAGRVTEFLAAFPAAAAREIATQIVEAMAGRSAGVNIHVGFRDDGEYGTPPRPFPPRVDIGFVKHFEKINIRG